MDSNNDRVTRDNKEQPSFFNYMLGVLQRRGTNYSKLISVTARESLNITIFCLKIIKSFAEHGRD